ncbi:hypothetical protein COCSADRAFT_352286 [Bipolaris sorokiniana ND90Pr]|uniref:Uncharacterized protein n=1 Tax=Cochliobolus sativus (strain ND90Pr / ATCC 201652) TaxID=665912 RepID=M2TDU9_COCSN|nr:uncharacterized protein COCSADRAFT_352286 [Bipolaris sorokiniana ND90Pr]EMD67416.1 hypothetical protein COCSADRAFT_352286 [Bipolaris sorokiniana ND90Pr]
MDDRYTFQASQASNNSHMNDSSSYRVPPPTVYPVQPFRPPMISMSPTNIPPQQVVFRDNYTALTYTRDQMVQYIWRRDLQNGKLVIRQAKGLLNPGSYTDLTTGTKYTHQQMIDLTGKILAEHLSRSKPQVNQVQPFQAVQGQQMQSSMQPSPVGYPPRGYTDGQAIQSQQRQEILDQQFVEQQARMTQQSLPQQQLYPPTQPSSHVSNAGQSTFIDKFGRQWSRAQYEELVRRQYVQKAQASAAMSSGLAPQFQQSPQTSSPMMMNSNNSWYANDMYNKVVPQKHSNLLQRQTGNIGPPPVPANSGAQQQRSYMPPPVTKSSQKPPTTDQSGRQWTQEQWEKVEKGRESKKILIPSSQATKASVPGNPTTQQAVYKQSLSKIQKQPSRQPASSVAQPKRPSFMQSAKQAVPREVKVTGKDVTNESLNFTSNSTSLAPVPQSNQPDQVSMSKQPNIASNTAPAPNSPPVSTQPTTISQWDVENGRHIYDSMTLFVSSRQEAYHEGLAKLKAATATVNTASSTAASNAVNNTTTNAVNRTVDNPTANIAHSTNKYAPLSFPHFDPSIFATVKHPQYTGFNDFSELNDDVLAEVNNQVLLKKICTVDPDGALRAPEPRWVSEERAKLEWEIRMVSGKYA